MNLKQMRAAALKAAGDIVAKARAEGRDLTDDEQTTFDAKCAEVKELDVKIAKAAQYDEVMGQLADVKPDAGDDDREKPTAAKSLGDHFVKSVGGADALTRIKEISGTTLAAPEWKPEVKAAGDPQLTPASLAPWLTQFDRTIVRAFRRPVVSDLFGSGLIGPGTNAITYLIEGAVEGAFTTVGEGGTKPPLHFTDPTTRTDALRKIAGILTFSDEMIEDLDFWVSEINQRGLYLLALAEEAQLLNGPGTGTTVTGLLNRSGIQTEAAADADDNADALYRAMSNVQEVTGLTADALVINPADYQRLRLSKDANGQYFAGGFFGGQYGNGDVDWQPPVWGLRTVVSPAVAAGTAVVGAFSTAATVYRKGGVRVESTNSHDDDFTHNRVRTRIEERVTLAVRIPAAFVEVTLSDVPAA